MLSRKHPELVPLVGVWRPDGEVLVEVVLGLVVLGDGAAVDLAPEDAHLAHDLQADPTDWGRFFAEDLLEGETMKGGGKGVLVGLLGWSRSSESLCDMSHPASPR